MAALTKRATIYLDPEVHRTLKLKAAEMSRSMSDLVNEVVKRALAEDAEDLAAFEERAEDPLLTYEEMVERLKESGRI